MNACKIEIKTEVPMNCCENDVEGCKFFSLAKDLLRPYCSLFKKSLRESDVCGKWKVLPCRECYEARKIKIS